MRGYSTCLKEVTWSLSIWALKRGTRIHPLYTLQNHKTQKTDFEEGKETLEKIMRAQKAGITKRPRGIQKVDPLKGS